VVGTEDRLVFQAPAQVRTTPGRFGSNLYEGTFKIWQRAEGGIKAGLYCDLRRYPDLAPDGLFLTMLGPGPLEIVKGHSFRFIDIYPMATYLRFPNDGDAEKVARLWMT
jgi:hypothetical protein